MAIFTLDEARSLLPQVKELTQHYHDLVEDARESLNDPQDAPEVAQVEKRMNALLQEWVHSIQDLGVDVKGMWLADFDSGDGYYYCWKSGADRQNPFHIDESVRYRPHPNTPLFALQ